MKLPPGYVPGVGVTKPTAYGGFGEKLLKQYGWKDGEGLGAAGSGIKSALKFLKKDDTIGVSNSLQNIYFQVSSHQTLQLIKQKNPEMKPELILTSHIHTD
jgi:hypothetical protein